MISNKYLKKFLAGDRVKKLYQEFLYQSYAGPSERIGPIRQFLAILISLLPFSAYYLHAYKESVDITTIFIGVAAVLALLFRVRHNIPFLSVSRWKESLSLTHTAFALGCIPAVILILVSPESIFRTQMQGATTITTSPPSAASIALFITGVSVWAGLTEEIIYRGLLISVLRRSSFMNTQQQRDIFAIILSSIIFGFVHYPVWGLPLSLALMGLGLGLGFAYIAVGELILPLIVYHIAFDVLSLSFALLVHKI